MNSDSQSVAPPPNSYIPHSAPTLPESHPECRPVALPRSLPSFAPTAKMKNMVERIRNRLAQELGITFEVKLVEKRTLERFEGKAKRVVDNRKL